MKQWEDIYISSGREKSAIIRHLQQQSGVTTYQLANSIGVSVRTFYNKLHRNSFTWDQMIILIQLCGGELKVIYSN